MSVDIKEELYGINDNYQDTVMRLQNEKEDLMVALHFALDVTAKVAHVNPWNPIQTRKLHERAIGVLQVLNQEMPTVIKDIGSVENM